MQKVATVIPSQQTRAERGWDAAACSKRHLSSPNEPCKGLLSTTKHQALGRFVLTPSPAACRTDCKSLNCFCTMQKQPRLVRPGRRSFVLHHAFAGCISDVPECQSESGYPIHRGRSLLHCANRIVNNTPVSGAGDREPGWLLCLRRSHHYSPTLGGPIDACFIVAELSWRLRCLLRTVVLTGPCVYLFWRDSSRFPTVCPSARSHSLHRHRGQRQRT